MNIAGDYVFDAPQEFVWRALQDPNVLGTVMPGGKGFEQIGDNQYSGVLEVKVGPVQGTFEGLITLSDIVAPESYQIQVDGKGAPGFVKAYGNMRLEARGNQTSMEYSGQAQVGGRIASVGQRLVDSAARSIIRQSLEALNAYLTIEVAQQALAQTPATPQPIAPEGPTYGYIPSPAQPVAGGGGGYRPPSQSALAFNLVRDVFNDIVPAKYRLWLIGALVVIIVLVIWLVSSR